MFSQGQAGLKGGTVFWTEKKNDNEYRFQCKYLGEPMDLSNMYIKCVAFDFF